MKELISRELRQALTSVSTKSAMNPALWLCALISLPTFILANFSSGILQVAFFVVGLLPLLMAIFLMFKFSDRPDLLQSEEYRLKNQALRVYGDSERKDYSTLPAIIGNQPLLSLEDLSSLTSRGDKS